MALRSSPAEAVRVVRRPPAGVVTAVVGPDRVASCMQSGIFIWGQGQDLLLDCGAVVRSARVVPRVLTVVDLADVAVIDWPNVRLGRIVLRYLVDMAEESAKVPVL